MKTTNRTEFFMQISRMKEKEIREPEQNPHDLPQEFPEKDYPEDVPTPEPEALGTQMNA